MLCSNFSAPEMDELIFYVIPEICAHWESIAYALKFKIADVDSITDTHNKDSNRCCRQLFKEWLSTNKGVSPKTWQVLLKKLEKLDLKAAVENIRSSLRTSQ